MKCPNCGNSSAQRQSDGTDMCLRCGTQYYIPAPAPGPVQMQEPALPARQFRKPREIYWNGYDFPDGYRIEIFIPKERVIHANAMQSIGDEVKFTVEAEAAKSFRLFDQYGNKMQEMGS